ncbi:TonB-dependent receptor [Marivirga sp. S37H4]|uniref:TonB-dependent receptor n=1 Tax=Marivirga aurantiaca TaxID=2802615 RepID=A0A934WZI2_9BACT|nr:TonB-dependent receptor [Marivirga aurantiaca]MBK6265717.1 TonB-dependent receptor [Marivirga aurantiaca]
MVKYLLLFCLVFLLVYKSSSQENQIQNDSILETVTVVGFDRGEQIHRQAALIVHLSARDMQNFSPIDPVMAWNSLPGVSLEQRAVGSYRVNIRGSSIRSPFGVRDVKVYWNGLPFTEANGSTALNLLSNTQMREVEVIKGPAGSLYGAGLGGVIHLNNFPDKTQGKLNIGVGGGSFGQFNAAVNGELESDKWTGFYAFDHQESDGYREHNALNRQVYQLSGRYQINDDHQLDLHALLSDLYYEIPGGLTKEQFEENPRQARPGSASQNASIDQKTLLLGAGYTSFFSQNLSQSTHLGFTYTDFQNPFILDYKEDINQEVALRHQWTYEMEFNNLGIQWDAGFEWQYADNLAENFGNVDGEKDSIHFSDELKIDRKIFFLQTHLGYQKWKLTLGLSSNLLNYQVNRNINAFAEPFEFERNFNNEIIPRVAVQYQWAPQQMTFASVSEGFSSPTLDEIRTNEGSINRSLQAERGRTYEVGHKLYRKRLQLDASVFFSALEETITNRTNENGVVLFQNAGETAQLGTEWGVNIIWLQNGKSLFNNISTRSAYQYYRFTFEDYQKREEDFSGNMMTGVPEHTLNQILHVKILEKISMNFHYRYVSEVPLTDANTIFADDYHLLNFRLNYEIRLGPNTFNLYAGVENLADIRYSLGNDLNAFGGRHYQAAPGRNIFAGLKWRFL